MTKEQLHHFIDGLPKAELHLHIEGTFEPGLMFDIAHRNRISIPYSSVEALQKAYVFGNLQDFLDMYYQGASVLLYEQDFYDLTMAYLKKAHEQNIKHTEIFFDPQTHTARGVQFETLFNGIKHACNDAFNEIGISTNLIMCFLRHLSEESAHIALEQALPFGEHIAAVGLDSSELGHPPSKFKNVFARARSEGFLTVAHAGEEGPAEYIHEAIHMLHVSRIDHGNNSLEDEELLEIIVQKQIPLTLCPLSNLKLQVIKNMEEYPLRNMMKKGIHTTINSDDPAYFGGYLNENYKAVSDALFLQHHELAQLAKNSFTASFISPEQKKTMHNQIDDYIQFFTSSN